MSLVCKKQKESDAPLFNPKLRVTQQQQEQEQEQTVVVVVVAFSRANSRARKDARAVDGASIVFCRISFPLPPASFPLFRLDDLNYVTIANAR